MRHNSGHECRTPIPALSHEEKRHGRRVLHRAGRPDERMATAPLSEADPAMADMATCVIIGSAETRAIDRGDKPALVYTPRFYAGASR